MSGPDIVRIKRKRSDQAPDALVVQHQHARPGKKHKSSEPDFHYVLQRSSVDLAPASTSTDGVQQQQQPPPRSGDETLSGSNSVQQQVKSRDAGIGGGGKTATGGLNGISSALREKRTFHLKRPSAPDGVVKKRKLKEDGIATFIEKRAKRTTQTWLDHAKREQSTIIDGTEHLKRPGKSGAVKLNSSQDSRTVATSFASHGRTNSDLEVVADSLHQYAIDEAAKEAPARPKVTARPKLPPQRSRELHQQRSSRNQSTTNSENVDMDMDLDEEADYVYDTYVLASSSGIGAAQIDSTDDSGNVGYLVITEEDQAVWETYLEDEPSDKDWNSDEDDENAEDWYGADYPDDELASDDEFDRNAYGYRRHGGSDDEQWNEDTGSWSDEEHERQMQPWRKKTPSQFSKYFSGVGNDGE